MNRKNFLELLKLGSMALAATGLPAFSSEGAIIVKEGETTKNVEELSADIIIAGAGVGGFASAMSALRNGQSVILTEETEWIGGQLTQQGLSCLDEHRWIETFGATQLYRNFRWAVREYYKQNYPVTVAARNNQHLNPGNGIVSLLCFEPRVALSVLYNFLGPYFSAGKLQLLLNNKIVAADVTGDKIRAVTSRNTITGKEMILTANYFIDATELGDLLPLTGTEYIIGSESRHNTNELHASEIADPKNQQAITFCFAMDFKQGENHVIDKPEQYNFWKSYVPKLSPPWPGKLLQLSYSNPSTLESKTLGFDPRGNTTNKSLNLWNYRKIIDRKNFKIGSFDRDITIVNWPQNDFFHGNIVDVNEVDYKKKH